MPGCQPFRFGARSQEGLALVASRPLAICLLDLLTAPRWPRPGFRCEVPPVSASTPHATNNSVSLVRAIRSDLDAAISALSSPVSAHCSLGCG